MVERVHLIHQVAHIGACLQTFTMIPDEFISNDDNMLEKYYSKTRIESHQMLQHCSHEKNVISQKEVHLQKQLSLEMWSRLFIVGNQVIGLNKELVNHTF